jgi:hypothetical protein
MVDPCKYLFLRENGGVFRKMRQIDSSTLTFYPFVSRDNPKAFLLALPPLDFLIDAQYQIQAQASQGAKALDYPFQSVYLDASAVTSGTTFVDIGTTGQTVAIRAGYQGYRPVLCNPGSQVFTFRNPGANAAGGSQVLKVFLLNIAVIGQEWGVLAGSGGSSGAVWG